MRDLAINIDVGTALKEWAIDLDPVYSQLVAKEFNMIVCENEMKFSKLQPQRGVFDFDKADKAVSFAKENNMKIRGHTLIWHTSLPDWIANGNFSKTELIEIMREHITTVMGRYRGVIKDWDVVNEIFKEDGTLRDSKWLSVIGEEYIELAFRFAHEADPGATLYLNDYNIEGLATKSDAAYQKTAELLSSGVPIHGHGFQMHFTTGRTFTYQRFIDNINRLKSLGLEVQFTEIDVQINETKPIEEELEKQAAMYSEIMRVALETGVNAYVTWGSTDKYTWTDVEKKPFIFDENYNGKPSYHSVKNELILSN